MLSRGERAPRASRARPTSRGGGTRIAPDPRPPPPPPRAPPLPPPENPRPPLEPGVDEIAEPRFDEKPWSDEESTSALNGAFPTYHELVCADTSMSLNARAHFSTHPNTIA